MKVAELLSDLTSLRACEYSDALALVNAHQTISPTNKTHGSQADVVPENPDVQRAKDLIELHKEARQRHRRYQNGGPVDRDLRQAREDVKRVLKELDNP